MMRAEIGVMATKRTNEQLATLGARIRDAVTEAYLETGKSLDAPAIAARLGWSESKLRMVMEELRGAPAGVHAHRDYRDSSSRQGLGYAPRPRHLRDLLNAAQPAPKSRPGG